MKSVYKRIERAFENFSEVAIKVFGNSITFIVAIILVIVYLGSQKVYRQNFHDAVYDIILCVTFLAFFIIQKSFNKYAKAIHLKINELVAAHDLASNRMVNVEKRSEEELKELEKYYSTLSDKTREAADMHAAHSIEHVIDEENKNDPTRKS